MAKPFATFSPSNDGVEAFVLRRRSLWIMRETGGAAIRSSRADTIILPGQHFDISLPKDKAEFVHNYGSEGSLVVPRIGMVAKKVLRILDESNAFVDDEERNKVKNKFVTGGAGEAAGLKRMSVGPSDELNWVSGTRKGHVYLFPGASIVAGSSGARGSDSWESTWILEDPRVYRSGMSIDHDSAA